MGHAHSIKEYPGQIAGIAALSAAVGALTAMLFTPRRGNELRNGIGRRAGDAKDTLMEKIHTKKDELSDTAKDKTAEAADRTKSIADRTKDKADR